jgi:16S rRNA (guanine527-N7)-methyltransferase
LDQERSEELAQLLSLVRGEGVPIDATAQSRILAYCQEVTRHSQRYGLVASEDIPHLIVKHVAASIGVFSVALPVPGEKWVDAGTGGGFPGMIVKLCRPDASLLLIDSSRKKTAFLSAAASRLGLADLEIVCTRMEEPFDSVWLGHAPTFDVILMRAVAPLERSLRWADGLAHQGSRLVTFKGPSWESDVAHAKAQMQKLGWTLEAATQIPWAQPKVLLLLKR